MTHRRSVLLLFLMLLPLTACVVNPVTGKRDIGLVSEQEELAIGAANYVPTQQSQGGEYVADPALTAYVKRVGQSVSTKSERKLPYEFVVLENSEPNAWALPGGKIAVNRGLLLELDNEAELAAVLGHEATHAAARHTARKLERSMLMNAGVVIAAVATRDSDYAGAILGGGLLGTQLISSKYGRDDELEADHYGMTYMKRAGYDPAAAVSLQQTFVRLFKDNQQNWLTGLFASHPPSMERVDRNRQTLTEIGVGGKLGEDAFRKATAHIRATRPAYEKFDQAQDAFAAGDTQAARALLDEAIAIEPNEARFHTLLGLIADTGGNRQSALAHYNAAVKHNPDLFLSRVARGRLELDLQQYAEARTDLERSIELLPTAGAHEAMGDLEMTENNVEAAIEHYKVAAGTDTPAGERARRKLDELELDD